MAMLIYGELYEYTCNPYLGTATHLEQHRVQKGCCSLVSRLIREVVLADTEFYFNFGKNSRLAQKNFRNI